MLKYKKQSLYSKRKMAKSHIKFKAKEPLYRKEFNPAQSIELISAEMSVFFILTFTK